MTSLFTGITILDFTRVFSGPLATLAFAQWGARVIKIEPPQGDDTRRYPPLVGDWSGYYEMLNHNKEGRVVDLKSEAGRREIYQLVSTVDVVVENFTPGAAEQLGIGYAALARLNPQIIYASLVGVDGACGRKYYDVIAQAESGLMSLSGESGRPAKIGPAVVDAFAGMNLAFAIAGALYYREKTGLGQCITVSMLASAMPLLEQNLTAASLTGDNPLPCGNADTAIAPFGVFHTTDGDIVIAAGNDLLWNALAQWLALYTSLSTELFTTNALRLQHQAALTAAISAVTSEMPSRRVLHELSIRGIPCGPVRTMLDVLQEPWFQAQALQTIPTPAGTSCAIPGTSFTLGRLQPEPYRPAPQPASRHDPA